MTATAFESIAVFDNRKHLLSTLGYTSPVQFLKGWIKTQQDEKQVA
jgi:putative transposase